MAEDPPHDSREPPSHLPQPSDVYQDMDEEKWTGELLEAVNSSNSKVVTYLLGIREKKICAPKYVKHLSKHESSEVYGNKGLIDALFAAINKDRESIAKRLLRSPGINLRENRGPLRRTALHQAVVMKKMDVVAELLIHQECVSFIDLGDTNGRAALHEAIGRGNEAALRMLLRSGANIEVSDETGMTPLHLGIWHNEFLEITKILVHVGGAEVNTRDRYGDTPLHDACSIGSRDAVRFLLACGADTDAKNLEGKRPHDVINNSQPPQFNDTLTPGFKPSPKEDIAQLFTRPRLVERRKHIPKIPRSSPQCLKNEIKMCEDFTVYVRYYWRGNGVSRATSTSIRGLVYEKEGTLDQIEADFETYLASIDPEVYENRSSTDPGTARKATIDKDVWRWIHFPANNMTWIKDFINQITLKLKPDERGRVWEFVERTIKDREGVIPGSSSRVPHAEDSKKEDRRGGGKRPISRHSHSTKDSNDRSISNGGRLRVENDSEICRDFPADRMLSVVYPYIDFETDEYLERTTKRGIEKSRHAKNMTKLQEIYPAFSGSAGLQRPQTLDSSYYNMLDEEKLRARDGDQVVLKWFQDRVKLRKLADINDQLMSLWKMLRDSYTEGGSSDEQTTTAESEDNGTRSPKNERDNKEESAKMSHATLSTNDTKYDGRQNNNSTTRVARDPEDLKPLPIKEGNDREAISMKDIPKMLMIHQLWLWKLDKNTIITSCPDRWHAGIEDTLVDTIRQGGIESFNEPEELIEHILLECATFLDEFRYAGVGDHILDIFDSTMALRADDEVQCFKSFLTQIESREQLKRFDRKAAKSIAKEIRLIYEIRDIRDEVHLLRRVFESQLDVLEKFTRIFWPGTGDRAKQCRVDYLEACGTKTLIDRTTRLDEDASRTLQELDYLVQVKQTQTSLDEAEAARSLNNFIMLFTIVTILFAPLSFMTSLFAMPVDQFPHDEDGDPRYSAGWVAWRMLAGEIVTIAVIAMIGVFIWSPHGLDYIKSLRKPRVPPPPPTHEQEAITHERSVSENGSIRRFRNRGDGLGINIENEQDIPIRRRSWWEGMRPNKRSEVIDPEVSY